MFDGLIHWFQEVLYAILVIAPLTILNSIYHVFIAVCGADLGKALFGANLSPGQPLTWDTSSTIFTWIIRLLYIAVVACVVLFIILILIDVARHEKINWAKKIKWPMLVFTSTIVIPLSFILISGLSMALFQIINGEKAVEYIYQAQMSLFLDDMTKGLNHLSGLSGNTIPIWDNTEAHLEHNLTYADAFKMMTTALEAIRSKATGNPTIIDQIDSLENSINDLTGWFGVLDSTGASEFSRTVNGMSNFMNGYNWTYTTIDQYQVLDSSDGVVDTMNAYINSINEMKSSWIDLINGIAKINTIIPNYTWYADLGTFDFTVTGESTATTYSVVSVLSEFGRFDTSWSDLNHYLLGVNLVDDTTQKTMLSLWDNILSSNSANQLWTWNGFQFAYTTFEFNGESSITNLSEMIAYNNPDVRNSMTLVVQIYQIITGHTDSNWTNNCGAEVGWAGVFVGFICCIVAIVVMGLFCLFACRRIAEIMVCTVWLIVSAVIGIVDDGKNFGTVRRVTIAKMFTSVIIFLCFEISMTVSNLIANNLTIDGSNTAQGLMKILLVVGSLLGGYGIANWIGNQYGDVNGLGETMRDMGVIGAGLGAAAVGGRIIGSAAAKTGKGVNKVSGERISAGLSAMKANSVNRLHNITGNRFRSANWRASERTLNVQKAAEAKGLGKFQTVIGKDGKATQQFVLSQKNKNAGEIYNKMMSNKGFSHWEGKTLSKATSLKTKPANSLSKGENRLLKKADKITKNREKGIEITKEGVKSAKAGRIKKK